MIRLMPDADVRPSCPHCGKTGESLRFLWQGVHTSVAVNCPACGTEYIQDLPVSHAVYNAFKFDLTRGRLEGPEQAREWLGDPFLQSFRNPDPANYQLSVEIRRPVKRVVIINCLDYLYGHVLLKLLNTESHLSEKSMGVVVIIPAQFRWLVPAGVSEVWSVDMPLGKGRSFFPILNEQINAQLNRFEQVWLSEAFSHPRVRNLERFTGTPSHDFRAKSYRITFVWREDRMWTSLEVAGRMGRLRSVRRLQMLEQHRRVDQLLGKLKLSLPESVPTVAGMGSTGRFSEEIEDERVDSFDPAIEKRLCDIYSQSRVVIGVHGSNMLLPSGHAGVVVDLMPKNRWGNFAQDIIFQERDVRMASFRYRFVPLGIRVDDVVNLVRTAVSTYQGFGDRMLAFDRAAKSAFAEAPRRNVS